MNVHCDQTRQRLPAARNTLWIFASALMGLLLVFRTHYSLYLTKGESMLPGLQSGDLVLVDKLAYRTTEPERGDIVVARDHDDLIVKRVVGLPGEEIELVQGKLRVNRQPFPEAYAVEPGMLSLQRGRLWEDRYALLGDNRAVSSSTVVHAVVAKEQIVGKVVQSLRLWPDWWTAKFNPAA
ncbi:MAG TPA: signal peptidase I [Verrucomicrobiota bacterium]|nr:signal peptidase I [Verrucomicrobiota bacterium]HNT14519.1 signal peptidase I [Verrucomicrobiota bacterium]